MPAFLMKPLSRLGRVAHEQPMAISDGIRPPGPTRDVGPGFVFNSPAGSLTSHAIDPGKQRPIAPSARTTSASIHSRLAILGKLLPVALLFAATAAACGGDDAGSASAPGATREPSSGASPSSPTRTVAPPTVSAVTNDSTPPAGSSEAGRAESPGLTATPVPTSTAATSAAGTSASTSQPSPMGTSMPEPSDAEPVDASMAQTLADHGEFYFLTGRYRRALQVLDRALEMQPEFARARALRGSVYAELGQFDDALADLDQAITLDPWGMRALLARSDVHTQLGAYEKAIQDGEAALAAVVRGINNGEIERQQQSDPARDAMTAMARAFFRAGNYHDYEDHAEGVLTGIEGYARTGIIIRSPFREQHDKLEEINNGLILQPNHRQLHLERTQVYDDVGWTEKVIEGYNRTAELFGPANPQTRFHKRARGSAHIEVGEYALAVQDFRAYENQARGTGRNDDPEMHGSAVMGLMWLYLSARSVEDAVRVLDDYNHQPTDFTDYRGKVLIEYPVLVGFLHAAQGDFDRAEKYLNVYFCDDEGSRCAYPDEIPVEAFPGTESRENIGLLLGERLRGWSGWTMATLADEIDSISVNRYLSRLFFYMHDIESGRGRYLNLLASQVLIEQAPDLPDGHIANAVAHLGRANLEVRNARDDDTAQPMLDHYHQAAGSLATFRSTAGPDNLTLGKPKLAEAYRILAISHLKRSSGPPEQNYRQEHFELAGEAYRKHSELNEPDREFQGEYAFFSGRVLASWDRKEDAQAAYKQAFDLGYDRRAVEEALADLSNR